MKIINLILLSLFFVSCNRNTFNEAQILIDKIEKLGIENFERIEFFSRGNREIYTYHVNDSKSYIWTYSIDKDSFDLKTHPDFEIFKNTVKSPVKYVVNLREKIQDLNVLSIGQAPWVGNLIRFWISQTEFISYINPVFEFDSTPKKRWQKELLTGKKIKDNWYYVTIKSGN
jgi:hypothetical protein